MPANSSFFKPLLTKIVKDASQAFVSSAAGLGLFALGSKLYEVKAPCHSAPSLGKVNPSKLNFLIPAEPKPDISVKSAEESMLLPKFRRQ